jgi:putative restriction endonuclease
VSEHVKKDSSAGRWSRDQLKLAYYLYCQLPFGKFHHRNPEVMKLATLIGRTPSAVAMKLSNFASLDPLITESGRKGLEGASQLDREVWNEFQMNWESLPDECVRLQKEFGDEAVILSDEIEPISDDFIGETRHALVELRVKQGFFRRAVLSSYHGRCCMSGLSESSLLVASHIVPWSRDKQNRLNPRNGLCLSAIHDRAFDKGLLTLSDDFSVIVAKSLRQSASDFTRSTFNQLHNRQIELPERFLPELSFIQHHRKEIFNGID